MRLGPPSQRHVLRATDSLQLTSLVTSYLDNLKGSYVIEIKNVPSAIENAQLGCRLRWTNQGKPETVSGKLLKLVLYLLFINVFLLKVLSIIKYSVIMCVLEKNIFCASKI